MIEKLNRQDSRLIALCVAISLVSIVVFQRLKDKAYPEASIPLDITSDEARDNAEFFLKNRQWDVASYRYAGRFLYDRDALRYLEKEIGAAETEGVFTRTNGWRWANRWFVPLQRKEYRVDYSTAGQLARFQRVLPEEAPGDSLRQSVARNLAEFFLAGLLNWKPDEWNLLEATSSKLENRIDHQFVWKEKGFEAAAVTHRILVEIQGAEVGQYREWLELPPERERPARGVGATIAGVVVGLSVLFATIISVLLLLRRRRRDIRWKATFALGAVFALLWVIHGINGMPAEAFTFDTNTSYPAYLGGAVLNILLFATLLGFLVACVYAGTELIYRRQFPRHIAFRNMLSVQGLKSRAFFRSTIIGLTLASFYLMYEVLGQLLAERIGVGGSLSVPDLNDLRTFPLLSIVFQAFAFVVYTEFFYRMLTLSFVTTYLKSRPIAIVCSALLWGLLVASNLEPFGVRLIEYAAFGTVIAWAFMRFGVLTTMIMMFSHTLFSRATFLFRSGDPHLTTTGALCLGVACIPLLYSLVSYRRLGGFLDATHLTNEHDTEVGRERPVPAIEQPFMLLTPKRARIGLAVAGAGVLLWLMPFHRDQAPLTSVRVNREEAEKIAREYLAELQLNLESHRVVVAPHQNLGNRTFGGDDETEDGSDVSRYVELHGGSLGVKRMYSQHLSPLEWQVRFYRPLEELECNVFVDTRSGDVVAYELTLPDSAQAPSVTLDRAEDLARAFLGRHGNDLAEFDLVGSTAVDHPHRKDFLLTFESNDEHPANVGNARLTYNVAVYGDRVGGFNKGLKLPERWITAHRAKTGRRLIVPVSWGALVVLFLAPWLVSIFRLVRQQRPPWKPSMLLALGLTLVVMTAELDGALFLEYSTSVSTLDFLLEELAVTVGAGVFLWFVSLLVVVSFQLMWPSAVQALRSDRGRFAGDALLRGFIGAGILLCFDPVIYLIARLLPAWAHTDFAVPSIAGYFPVIGYGTELITSSVLAFMLLFILRYLYLHHVTPRPMGVRITLFLLVIGGIAANVALDAGNVDELVGRSADAMLTIAAISAVIFFWRSNPLGALVGVFLVFGVESVDELMRLEHPSYHWQSWLLAAMVVIPLALLGWRAWRGRSVKSSLLAR